ncbi:UDP-glycosyltransferase 83A1 [Mucuna pruriens]|uniref:UDP-glycosyltransferase 83A1 n=1 Tax=Mucuna pruriens TaxID=157652 RepID=A0A371HW56_MUCPR|nr:UDP-glycosyltransferase 83A1 [Mucuna pruriens]
MGIPHFLLIPYPTQGHVNPLMQLSEVLAMHGCKITFLNTEFNHKRANTGCAGLDIKFVTLPDGLGPEDDRSDHKKVIFSIKSHMPAMLPKLIQDINALDVNNNITCIIVTVNMGWALEVGHNLGIKGALLWPASATSLAICDCIPRLIDDGIIDSDGNPIKKQEIQLSPNMPMMDTANFPWCGLGKILFHHIAQEMQTIKLGDWWLCNTTHDLELAAFSISPQFLPIGPLMESDSNKSSPCQGDTTCLEWLDQQPPQSVIYVAFGSSAVIDHNQFKELALGLDFLNKPFLWVVHPSNDNKLNNAYPDEFHGSKGRIIGWAPQKKILNHPSIACFISHCGWNSTIEGVCGGVPFLCWPLVKDQFVNKSYICDVWKVGVGLDKDENGIITKGEIRKKVEQLLGDEGIKAMSLKLKELTLNNIGEGAKMGIPHFLVIPYPVLGHVNPLIHLSQILVKHGCSITFLNTEFSHKRLNATGAGLDNLKGSGIKFVTLPDGLCPEDDRSDQKKVVVSITTNMPSMLPNLIQDVNALDANNNITCIIVTISMGWALKVGHNLGIKGAFLWPASATSLVLCDCIPRLTHDGIINSFGIPIKKQEIQLSPNMPLLNTENFPWRGHEKLHYNHLVEEMQTMKLGEWWLCNTAYDLEPPAFSISPRFLPIGPLMASDSHKSSFWEEDTTCLEWLNEQLPQSVVYVSFGSLAVIDPNQFKELALGLDFLNKPFLWVVRPSNDNKVNNAYPDEFHGSKGRIVGWAPQKKILNHPSIACFISHCGWNSTLEGICGGVPFLCWPFVADQFINKSYLCDVWKVGVGLDKNENGLISKILAKHGCNITFLNTEFSHKRLNTNGAGLDRLKGSGIKFVTLPDGLCPEDDRSDQKKVVVSIKTNMPSMLPNLIQDVNALDVNNKITCIVVTLSMSWALKVARNLGIKRALLWPASATSLALCDCIPRLIHDGIIDSYGIPTKKQEIQLSPNMPLMDTENLPWRGHDKLHFDHLVQEMQTMKLGEWWLCNTTYDLEPAAFSISPRLLPIGPLMASDSNKSSFWEEDTTCLEWLDEQLPQSVVYVSFGSMAVMDPKQFKELALAFDLLDKPFIWVEEIRRKVEQLLGDEDIKARSLKLKELTMNNIAKDAYKDVIKATLSMKSYLSQMGIPHFLVIPYPVLGHVNPLMQLSECLAKHGCKITFLNTEFNHKRANNAGAGLDNLKEAGIKFVTLPDGLGSEDDRSDQMKVLLSIKSNMPAMLPKLIEDINALDVDNNITCIVVTMNMGWALEVAQRLGIQGAFLWTASATSLAACYCIPALIHDGIIDSQGVPTKKQEIQLSPNMPMMDTADLPWGGLHKFFPHIVQEMKTLKLGEWWLCNTTCDLEPQALAISPIFLPIGPLKESDSNKSSFWEEDTTCLEWLDQHPPQSVVYVSFGSLATVEPNQFKELALGLDLLDMPFLWVVRPSNDNTVNNNAYPDEFRGSKGKIVNWVPQRKILNHPAIACFISHCGWNSTIEGVYSGVPFLCWPFFSDQFVNRFYICHVWKVGLKLDKDEKIGLILKGEIRKKVEQLLGNEDIKARSLKLKESTVNNSAKGGQSSKNLQTFINWATSNLRSKIAPSVYSSHNYINRHELSTFSCYALSNFRTHESTSAVLSCFGPTWLQNNLFDH